MKNTILKSAMALSIALTSSFAFAGGGGSGSTQCYAQELGYIYSFSGYAQSLAVGKTLTVFKYSPGFNEYGHYQIDSLNLSQEVGVVELSYLPDTQGNASTDTNYGSMKIEYFSDSALKDIKVTFTKAGIQKTSNVTCVAH